MKLDDALYDRINALDDFARKSVLQYLAGYAPETVKVALDEMASQAAAQDTEARDG